MANTNQNSWKNPWGKKHTQNLPKDILKKCLKGSLLQSELDLLIESVQILDLVNGELIESNIAIVGEYIVGIGPEYKGAKAQKKIDGHGLCAVPGFIDGHLHIESSLMHPFEFERLTLPLGTTTAICDPHEITNVLGNIGLEWFLRSATMMRQNLFVQISSCVPALEGFETNGAPFTLQEMEQYKNHPHVIGLAEMMNFPGVINGDDKVLDKILSFSQDGLNLDGHSPLLQGKELNAYLMAGIQNCHETVTYAEGQEKLTKGMALIIREGSVAKNLKTLAPLATEFNSTQCFLCTDDRNPYEIFHEGHINYLIKKLINELAMPAHMAYRLASYSAAKHFHLNRLGLIAPGFIADIVLLEDLKQVKIKDVISRGQKVSDFKWDVEQKEKLQSSNVPIGNSMKREPLNPKDFNYQLQKGLYNVIEIIPNEIITNHLKISYDGKQFEQEDIYFLAVIERYSKKGSVSLGLVTGLGSLSGSIASSVAHDSHNIIVIGSDADSMASACNHLLEKGGGFVVAQGEKIKACLELPIAGLISLESAEDISAKLSDLKREFKILGVNLHEPFLQMAFLALPVIPSLKITDKGLFDVTQFKFIPLRAEA